MRSAPALLLLCLVFACFSIFPVFSASASDDPISPADLGMERVTWSIALGELSKGAIINWCRIDGRDLFVMDSERIFHCISLDSGMHRWIVKLPGDLTHAPGISDESLCLVMKDRVILVKRSNGSRTLDKTLRVLPSTSPAVTPDSIYAGVFIEKKMQALDSATGMAGWSFRFRDFMTAAPQIYGQGSERFLYGAANDGRVICLPVKSAMGAPPSKAMWTAETQGPVTNDLTLSGEHLYVVSDEGSLYAFHRLTGQVLWRYFAGVPIVKAAQAADGLLFVRTSDGVRCLNAEDGKRKWTYNAGVKVATVLESGVVFLTLDKTLALVDLETGEPKSEAVPSRNICVVPSIGTGKLIVVSDSTITAVE